MMISPSMPPSVALFQEAVNEMGTYEPGSTGNEDAFTAIVEARHVGVS